MRRRNPKRGDALVEFALCFTVTWLLLSGVFQYGYTFWIYNGLVSSVSSGARFASMADYTRGDSTFETAVKNMVAYGNPKGTGAAMVPGLSPSNVRVRVDRDANGVPGLVTVSVDKFTVDAVFRKFTFDRKPSTSMRWAGRYIVP